MRIHQTIGQLSHYYMKILGEQFAPRFIPAKNQIPNLLSHVWNRQNYAAYTGVKKLMKPYKLKILETIKKVRILNNAKIISLYPKLQHVKFKIGTSLYKNIKPSNIFSKQRYNFQLRVRRLIYKSYLKIKKNMLFKYLKHKISIKKLTFMKNQFSYIFFKLAKYFILKKKSLKQISKIILIFKIIFMNFKIDVSNHKKFFVIFFKV